MGFSDPEKDLSGPPSENSQGISVASSVHHDDNYALYKNGLGVTTEPEEVKRVLRKIDYRIIPILFVTYFLQYLDKNSINFASVYGLKTGTHLVGQDYSWLGTTST
jgi:hypothetical protein